MTIEIRSFQPGDEDAFRRLNEAWIEAYFRLEEKDRAILGDPRRYILEPGGHISIAADRSIDSSTQQIVGCCALIAMQPSVYEVAKMAVAEHLRSQGIGRKLLRHVIATARTLGAHRLYIETNHALENAIALYSSEGFRHLRPQDVQPSPYDRADVFLELYL